MIRRKVRKRSEAEYKVLGQIQKERPHIELWKDLKLIAPFLGLYLLGMFVGGCSVALYMQNDFNLFYLCVMAFIALVLFSVWITTAKILK